MKRINTLLAALPLDEAGKQRLKEMLPNTEIIFAKYLKADESDVRKADVIFGNVNPKFIEGCDKLRWIQLCSSGSDPYIPVLPKGVLLTNATTAYGPAIGEYMLAALMTIQKDLLHYHGNQAEGIWRKVGNMRSFENSTCLVLGLGDIGGNFAKRAKALGARIIGVRRADTRKPDYVDELYLSSEIKSLLPRADYVAMSLPNTPDTTRLINKETLALMKPSAVLINVGRGTAIDQEALIDALNNDRLRGAVLDVTDPEPLPSDHPLWRAKNILITPHISGNWTLPSIMDRTLDIFQRNLEAYFNDSQPENIVDLVTGYRKLI